MDYVVGNSFVIDPKTVTTSTSSQATATDFEGQVCYANGRYWLFYYDGTSEGWRTSIDGNTWNSETTITTGGAPGYFGFRCTATTVYYASEATSNGAKIYYDSGTLNSVGSISWGTEGNFATTGNTITGISTTIDSNGYWWVSFGSVYTSFGNNYGYLEVWRCTTPSLCNWSQSTGFIVGATYTPYAKMTNLTSGKVSVVYVAGPGNVGSLNIKTYSGSAWSSSASTGSTFSLSQGSCVSLSDTTECGVYDNNAQVGYLSAQYNGNSPSWSSETVVASSCSGPYASIGTDGHLRIAITYACNGGSSLSFVKSLNGGSSWTTPYVVSTSQSNPQWVSMAQALSPNEYISAAWTTGTASPYNVDFLTIPSLVPVADPGAGSWSRPGLSPFESYFSHFSDYLSPGNGLVSVEIGTLDLAGRGMSFAPSIVYSEPYAFRSSGSPYLYENYTGASLGYGWSLNFPWLGTNYLHLSDGQAYPYMWNGNTFQVNGATNFVLTSNTGGTYTLTLPSGTVYQFDSSKRLTSIADRTRNNAINFSYGTNNFISQVTDTISRTIGFSYTNNQLTSITSGTRSWTFGYTGSQLTSLTDPLSRVTTFQYVGTSGANAWLLSAVVWPTGGKVTYSYGSTSVGTEETTYDVNGRNVYYDPTHLSQSQTISYILANGMVTWSNSTFSDGTTTQEFINYNFQPSKNLMKTYKGSGSIGPSTPGTVTGVYPSGPLALGGDQRQVFWAQYRWWLTYYDGTNMVFRTSPDGVSWSAATTLRASSGSGAQFAGEYTNTKYCYAYESGSTAHVRCGTLGSGTISWSSAGEMSVTLNAQCSCNNNGGLIAIQNDTNNNIWIVTHEHPSSYQEEILEGTSCGGTGCTWASKKIISGHGDVAIALQLPSGEMGFITATSGSGNAGVTLDTWSGSSFNTESSATASLTVADGGGVSAVAVGSTIYITGALNSGNKPIHFYSCTYSCSSITDDGQIVSQSNYKYFLNLATDGNGKFILSFDDYTGPSTTIDFVTCSSSCTTSTNWSSVSALTSAEVSIQETGAGSDSIVNGCPAVAWEAGTSSPYNVRFATVGSCGGVLKRITETDSDTSGRTNMTKIISPTNALLANSTYAYDSWGNQKYMKDNVGQKTWFSYANTDSQNSFGNPSCSTSSFYSQTVPTNIHDALLGKCDFQNGPGTTQQETFYLYDGSANLIQQKTSHNGDWVYTEFVYDRYGNVIQESSPHGNGCSSTSQFGSGSSGSVTFSTSTTISSNKQYSAMTVNSGVTVTLANGVTVQVCGVLMNSGFITGSGSSGGIGNTGGGGNSGSNGGTAANGPTVSCNVRGGSNGAAGSSGNGGTGAASCGAGGGSVTGGSSGAAGGAGSNGNAGGQGTGGGNAVSFTIDAWVVNNVGSITANGGNGGMGGTGGNGGSGGNGGTGGAGSDSCLSSCAAGGGGGGSGGNGGNGGTGGPGGKGGNGGTITFKWSIGTGSGLGTITATAGIGGAGGSGGGYGTYGTGGSGGSNQVTGMGPCTVQSGGAGGGGGGSGGGTTTGCSASNGNGGQNGQNGNVGGSGPNGNSGSAGTVTETQIAAVNFTYYRYSSTYTSAYLTKQSILVGTQNVTTTYTYDLAKGFELSMTDPNLQTTSYAYDSLGRLTQITYPAVGGTSATESYTYYDNNNTMKVVDENGHVTKDYFDGLARMIKVERWNGSSAYSTTKYTYNWVDAVATMTMATNHTYTYSYDWNGRLTKLTNPDNTYSTTSYNDVKNLKTVADERGHQTTYVYDWDQRLISVKEYNSTTNHYATYYTYDLSGNQLTSVDGKNQSTSYQYDDLNRLTQTTFPDTKTELRGYDSRGNMITRTTANSSVISYTYDALNRLTMVTYPGSGGTVTYSYDADSNRVKMVNPSATDYYAYDAMDRLTNSTEYVGGVKYQTMYSYDKASNLLQLTYPDSYALTMTYDAVNRRKTVGSFATISYTLDDKISTIKYGNGEVATYTYDTRDRPTRIIDKYHSTTEMDLNYTYDGVGNVKKINTGENYGYDWLNRLNSSSGPWTSITFAYDQVGNRIRMVQGSTTTYTYGSFNRLSSAGSISYTYDANGNTITKTGGWTYSYDYENRLTKVVQAGTTAQTNSYDGDGNRVKQVAGSSTFTYSYQGLNILYEKNVTGSTTTITKHFYANGLQVAKMVGSTVYYLHQDALGSTRLVATASVTIKFSSNYVPYGNNYAISGKEEFMYTGKIEDSATGLYYYGARYYDLTIGRFVTQDSYQGDRSDPMTLNLYTYARDNPEKYVDPTGHRIGWASGTDFVAADGGISGCNTRACTTDFVAAGPGPGTLTLGDPTCNGSPDACASHETATTTTLTSADLGLSLQLSLNMYEPAMGGGLADALAIMVELRYLGRVWSQAVQGFSGEGGAASVIGGFAGGVTLVLIVGNPVGDILTAATLAVGLGFAIGYVYKNGPNSTPGGALNAVYQGTKLIPDAVTQYWDYLVKNPTTLIPFLGW